MPCEWIGNTEVIALGRIVGISRNSPPRFVEASGRRTADVPRGLTLCRLPALPISFRITYAVHYIARLRAAVHVADRPGHPPLVLIMRIISVALTTGTLG
jgi:hypothetical protein